MVKTHGPGFHFYCCSGCDGQSQYLTVCTPMESLKDSAMEGSLGYQYKNLRKSSAYLCVSIPFQTINLERSGNFWSIIFGY